MSDYNNTIKSHKDGGGNCKIHQNDAKIHQNDAKERRNPRAGDEHGAGRAGGLSTYHITRKIDEKMGSIQLYIDGSLISVSKNRLNPYAGQKRSWTRGKIKGFSKASRRRLMRKLAVLDKNKLPQFMTLTYPKIYPLQSEVWKYQLDKFIKRMKYRFPDFCAIWKLEFQKRGAPHFHLLVWGLPPANHIYNLVSKLWFDVVGSGDEKHLKAGTQIQKIRSWKGVMAYASKYMGKEIDGADLEVGRFWGVVNADLLPYSRIEKYQVFQNQIVMAMRMMRRYARIKSRDYSSLSIYVNDPQEWKRALLC
jgi:hypothetical protein